ncbi:hypothetical protein [Brevundimonas vesicularis]|uniref:hypothetical protein n=1 Tax=Brevundimonas vesicularis TaxID=41276 RepID=UPI0022ABF473|nr:hypothetical protein [Brevundimonas vesicularis]
MLALARRADDERLWPDALDLVGENAAGRRREVEVFAEALKARGDGFDDEMFGEACPAG